MAVLIYDQASVTALLRLLKGEPMSLVQNTVVSLSDWAQARRESRLLKADLDSDQLTEQIMAHPLMGRFLFPDEQLELHGFIKDTILAHLKSQID